MHLGKSPLATANSVIELQQQFDYIVFKVSSFRGAFNEMHITKEFHRMICWLNECRRVQYEYFDYNQSFETSHAFVMPWKKRPTQKPPHQLTEIQIFYYKELVYKELLKMNYLETAEYLSSDENENRKLKLIKMRVCLGVKFLVCSLKYFRNQRIARELWIDSIFF